ncbi:MAG: hypothetical protein EOP45_21420 [Sphingobacteriaceae bacterium]|nr:MAG: hypothetical protein EOP45_21420 [Sphingobacteriaceae bacterium]
MAQINIEDIVDHLSYEMKRALEATLEEHFPGRDFDRNAVFKTFKKKVSQKCSTWESVPDDLVEL